MPFKIMSSQRETPTALDPCHLPVIRLEHPCPPYFNDIIFVRSPALTLTDLWSFEIFGISYNWYFMVWYGMV